MAPKKIHWRSRQCMNGGCVEVALDGNQVLVRDGGSDDSPVISYTASIWSLRLEAMRRAYDQMDRSRWLPLNLSRRDGGVVWHKDQTTLRFTTEEWDIFVDAALAGDFDVDRLAEMEGRPS